MSDKKIQPAHHCCGIQKQALKEALLCCDFNSESPEQRRECYRKTAKNSGWQARACLYS